MEGIKLSPQQQRIVDYMQEFGSISPLEAFRDLGVTKLATQISYMRRYHNIKIRKERMDANNRFGETVHYMRYYLQKDVK